MINKILACMFATMLTLTGNAEEKKFGFDSPHYGTQQFCILYAAANISNELEENQSSHYAHFEAEEKQPTCYIQATFEIDNDDPIEYDKMTDAEKSVFKVSLKTWAKEYFEGTTNQLRSRRNVRVKIRLTVQIRTKDTNEDNHVMVTDTTNPEFKKGLTF